MKLLTLVCVLAACLFSTNSFARDDIQTLPVQALLETSKAKQALLDIPLFVSQTEYQCGAGTFVAGVALKGTLVKL